MNIDLLLSNISKHISLTGEETDLFVSLLNTKTLMPGDLLLREGDVCRHIGFVTRGCLKSYYADDNASEHIIDFLPEEWWADDLYSFFTGTPAGSNIKAIEQTDIILLSKENTELLYQRVPKFEKFFRILFQNAYISQKEQINAILSASAEERYITFLKKKPYAEARFTQKDIASYLGVTPQFLSTMKKRIRSIN